MVLSELDAGLPETAKKGDSRGCATGALPEWQSESTGESSFARSPSKFETPWGLIRQKCKFETLKIRPYSGRGNFYIVSVEGDGGKMGRKKSHFEEEKQQ